MIAQRGPDWKGHLLRFEPAGARAVRAGERLAAVLIVAVVEGVVGLRLGVLRGFGVEAPPMRLRVPLLLVVVLAVTRWFAHVRPSQLGPRGLGRWTTTEKSYFV